MKEIELLVLVKAYPNPSQALGEACCVIGVSVAAGGLWASLRILVLRS